jgi:hypothetical protein
VAAAVCALAIGLAATAAAAEPRRFAVLVGHNRGAPDEPNLRFAETDAERVRDVLLDLGGFAAEDVVLLQGRSAPEVRRALIAVNERVRAVSRGSMLLVYYSGHADARALHLGGSTLEVDELEQLVRGSSAQMRLLIVDACRSGTLTRVKGSPAVSSKGGTKTEAFPIDLAVPVVHEGAVFLTASAANEDAQESDELRGSFFTHYLLSGLLGAADVDRDARVTLEEAYRHAYERTLRASSRSAGGIQHPTFRYTLAGHGTVVLTRLEQRGDRGTLEFPPGRAYLVMEQSADGRVVAEVGAPDTRRAVSLRPGRYFVRGRGREHLLEGAITLARAEHRVVQDRALARIAYARLVRKGGPLTRATALELDVGVHSALQHSDRACAGLRLGMSVDYRHAGFGLGASWCRDGFENERLLATNDEAWIGLRGWNAIDIGRTTIAPGIEAGIGAVRQRFETTGFAPTVTSLRLSIGVVVRIARELHGRAFWYLDPGVDVYTVLSDGTASVRIALGVGMRR